MTNVIDLQTLEFCKLLDFKSPASDVKVCMADNLFDYTYHAKTEHGAWKTSSTDLKKLGRGHIKNTLRLYHPV